MAKPKQKKVNRAQAIRDILAKDPDATPTRIVALLANKKIKVTNQYVSMIKSTSKRAGPPAGAKASGAHNDRVLNQLRSVQRLANEVGGVDRLNELVGFLAKLR